MITRILLPCLLLLPLALPPGAADHSLDFTWDMPIVTAPCGPAAVAVTGTYLGGSGAAQTWAVRISGRTPFPQNCPSTVQHCIVTGSIENGFSGDATTCAVTGAAFSWTLAGTGHTHEACCDIKDPSVPSDVHDVALTLGSFAIQGTLRAVG